MKKVLIVKTSSLGDIIHGFFVLPYLHRKFPEVEVSWVVEKGFADLVSSHPLVKHVLTIDTKSWKKSPFSKKSRRAFSLFKEDLQKTVYDEVFDLQGNIKSAVVTFFSKAKHKVGFTFRSAAEWPASFVLTHRYAPPKGENIRLDYLYLLQAYYQDFYLEKESQHIELLCKEEEKQSVQALLRDNLVLVCPGSRWKNKQLRPESLEIFLEQIRKKFPVYFLFSWGTMEEKRISARLQRAFPEDSLLLEKGSLASLQYLMQHVKLVIAMDSLPLHLCSMTNTPSFSIFGASRAGKYKPFGENHKAEQGSCPYGQHFEKRCKHLRTCNTGLCIRGLSGEYLFERFLPFARKIFDQ